jgi:hypothetical protein
LLFVYLFAACPIGDDDNPNANGSGDGMKWTAVTDSSW